jgi:KUP system potassium uptake protein
VSLILWTLILVVPAQIRDLIMRADNHGERRDRGAVALLDVRNAPPRAGVPFGRRLIGAALLYGDGVITPAIRC